MPRQPGETVEACREKARRRAWAPATSRPAGAGRPRRTYGPRPVSTDRARSGRGGATRRTAVRRADCAGTLPGFREMAADPFTAVHSPFPLGRGGRGEGASVVGFFH